MTMKKGKGSQFIRFFKPIIECLQTIGGSGTVSEVIDRVIEMMKIPESEQEITLKDGTSRVRNQIQWARLDLVKLGYLDSSKRGMWSLTEKGISATPQSFDVLEMFKEARKIFR